MSNIGKESALSRKDLRRKWEDAFSNAPRRSRQARKKGITLEGGTRGGIRGIKGEKNRFEKPASGARRGGVFPEKGCRKGAAGLPLSHKRFRFRVWKRSGDQNSYTTRGGEVRFPPGTQEKKGRCFRGKKQTRKERGNRGGKKWLLKARGINRKRSPQHRRGSNHHHWSSPFLCKRIPFLEKEKEEEGKKKFPLPS